MFRIATYIMPTSKIRVSSQGAYASWLVSDDTVRPAAYGAWYPAEWQPPKDKGEVINVALVSGAACTITWEK